LIFAGAKYHLTQRGNGGQEVFLDPADRERFLDQLDHCLAANKVILYAYCLMPNHYHLFVETPEGNVQRFMQRLNTAYAMYFRYRHQRPGHCWQGRYGAKLVSGDEYILGLIRYIHLNPVKKKDWAGRPAQEILRRLNRYVWSSYRGYAGWVEAEPRIDYRWLALVGSGGMTGRRNAYRKHAEQMACVDDGIFLKAVNANGYAIGDQEYMDEVAAEVKANRRRCAAARDIAWPEDRRPGLAAVEKAVQESCGLQREDLHCHGRHAGLAKAMAIELCCRLSGKSQRAVGEYFGYKTDAGVCRQRRRLAARLESSTKLGERMEQIEKAIVKV
jgi:REP element-mobilizing transposase RayT